MKHPKLVEVMNSASLTCFSKLRFSLVSFLDAAAIDSYKKKNTCDLNTATPLPQPEASEPSSRALGSPGTCGCCGASSCRAMRHSTVTPCSQDQNMLRQQVPPPPPPRVSYQRLAVKCLICLQPNSSSMQSQLGWFMSLLIVISEFYWHHVLFWSVKSMKWLIIYYVIYNFHSRASFPVALDLLYVTIQDHFIFLKYTTCTVYPWCILIDFIIDWIKTAYVFSTGHEGLMLTDSNDAGNL